MSDDEDPLRAARGMFWGLVWSLVFWALLAGCLVW